MGAKIVLVKAQAASGAFHFHVICGVIRVGQGTNDFVTISIDRRVERVF